MEAVFSWISHYGYPPLFLLLMLGIVGLPVPDETLLVFCGYLISRGRLQPVLTFFAAWCGSMSGITLSFVLGRTLGHKVVDRFGNRIGLTVERVNSLHRWFDRVGAWLLTIGYFIPGVRHFTAVVAGMGELRWSSFALFAYTGAAGWVAFFLWLGYKVGEKWQQTSEAAHRVALEVCAVLVVAGALGWLLWRWRRR